MVSNKSVGKEYTIDRIGVSWRKNRLSGKPTKCVVEMRPPNWTWKLHFGSYDTEVEAMIARDYAALLRVSAGEDVTSAGGFSLDDHPSICEFDESRVIFTGMEIFKVRCEEYKRLVSLYHQQPKENCGPNSPYTDFCNEARKDIAIAIGDFRRRYPHKFVNCWRATEAAEDLENVDGSLDGGTHFTPSSSSFDDGGNYQSLKTSSIANNKQKLEQLLPEHHKENFPSGMVTFNHLSSSPDGKLCQVIRGFHGNSMFDKQSPWIKENSNDSIRKDSKSLLQVQLANCNPPEPSHERFKMQDDGVPTVGFSPRSSYASYNTQPASLESVVTANRDQWMSPISITCSGAPGSLSLSAGTSVEDDTGLSYNNRNSCHQELAQIEEQFTEGEGDHLQLTHSSITDHDTNLVSECYMENNYQNVTPDNYQWVNDVILLNGDECLEEQTTMDIDEMVKTDQFSITIPGESKSAPSHMLATTPCSTSEVERTMCKLEVMERVVSKVASNKVMSKSEMVEKRFKSSTSVAKGFSVLSAKRQALLAAQLKLERVKLDAAVQQNKLERVKLDMAIQQNNTLIIANLKTAKEDGVISDDEYIQHVKALLKL